MTFNVNTAKAAPLGLLAYDGDGPGRASFDVLKPLLLSDASSVSFLAQWEGAGARTVQDRLDELPTSVKEFGAKVDGVWLLGVGAMEADSTTLVVTSGDFTEADVGKTITVEFAKATNEWLCTTIASVTNATTVELDDAATVATEDADVIYGTDDTDSIRAALASPANVLFIPAGICILNNNSLPYTVDNRGETTAAMCIGIPAGKTLMGAGREATHITATFMTTSGFVGGFFAFDGDYGTLRDMRLTGVFSRTPLFDDPSNGNPAQFSPGSGMESHGVHHCLCYNLFLENFGIDALSFRNQQEQDGYERRGSSYNRIDLCISERSRSHLKLQGREDQQTPPAEYNVISRTICRDAYWWRGLEARFARRNLIVDCLFERNTGNASDAQLVFEGGSDFNVVLSSTFRDATYGVGCSKASVPSRFNRFIGCLIEGHGNSGALIKNSHYNSFESCTFYRNANRAIYVFSEPAGTNITLFFPPGTPTDWEDGDIFVGESKVGVLGYYNEYAAYMRLDPTDGIIPVAIGDTIVQGEREGVVVDIQSPFNRHLQVKNCRFIENGSVSSESPVVNAAAYVDYTDNFFYRNYSRIGIRIGGATQGRITGNFFRDTLASNTALQADIVLDTSTSDDTHGVLIEKNDTLYAMGRKARSFDFNRHVPFQDCAMGVGGGRVQNVTYDADSLAPNKVVGWANLGDVRQVLYSIAKEQLQALGITYCRIRARVKDDGESRNLRVASLDVNSESIVATGGDGEWEWIEYEIAVADMVNSTRIRAWDDGSTILFDGYILEPITEAVATAAELADIADAINTTAKYPGKRVRETTNAKWVRAEGATAADDWIYEDGTTPITPA